MKSPKSNTMARPKATASSSSSPPVGAAGRGTIRTSIKPQQQHPQQQLQQQQPPRDMIEIGLDIGLTEADKEKRIKKGECPSCGNPLYKVTGIGLLTLSRKKKTPLTIQGLVHNGRCLQCQPVRALPGALVRNSLEASPKKNATTSNSAAATGGFRKAQSITRERGQLSGLSDAKGALQDETGQADEVQQEYCFDEAQERMEEEAEYEDVRNAAIPRFLSSDVSIGEISAITLDHRLRHGEFTFHHTMASAGGAAGEAFQEEDDDDIYREQQQETGVEENVVRKMKSPPYCSDDEEEPPLNTGGPPPRPEPDDRSTNEPEPPQRKQQHQQHQQVPEIEIRSYRSFNYEQEQEEAEALRKAARQMMNHSPPGGGGGLGGSMSSLPSPHSPQPQRTRRSTGMSEESKHEIMAASPRHSHAVYNPPWAAIPDDEVHPNSASGMGSAGIFGVDDNNMVMLSPPQYGGGGGGGDRMRNSSNSEIFFDSSQLCDLETAELQVEAVNDDHDNEQRQRNRQQNYHDSASRRRQQRNNHHHHYNQNKAAAPPQQPSIEQEIHLLPEFLPVDHDLIPPVADNAGGHYSFNNSFSSQQQQQRHSERDIPSLLTALKTCTRNRDWTSCIEALQALTLVIWKSSSSSQAQRGGSGEHGEKGGAAKRIFAQGRGIAKLNEIMWSDFMNQELQLAAFDLILALAAFPESSSNTHSVRAARAVGHHQNVDDDDIDGDDVLVGEAAQNLVDALLLVMRELSHNEMIQQTGCRILLCLAKASSENAQVHDGSMSGSVEVVLQAMQRHGSSSSASTSSTSAGGSGGSSKNSIVPAVQEWGMRTLYEQCTASRHAESNKRTLLRWNNNNNSSGGGGGDQDNNDAADSGNGGEVTTAILLQAMKYATQDAVKLYWCLTSSEDIAAMLSPKAATDTMTALLRHVHRAIKDEQSIMTSASASRDDDFVIDLATENGDLLIILEAAIATISNLVRIPENGNVLRPTLVAQLTLDILEFHLSAIDRLLRSREAAVVVDDVILTYCNNYLNLCTESVGLVANLANLDKFDKEEIVQAGGIHRLVRALTIRPALTTASSDGNRNGKNNSAVVEALHEEAIRALLCLAVDSEPVKTAIVGNGELFASILQTFHIYEQAAPWQEMMCRLLASLFSRKASSSDGSMLENDGLYAICAAMQLHADSERVQETACLALRNIASREQHTELLLRSEAVGLAVYAMARYEQSRGIQTHVSGMLWGLGIRATEAYGDGGNSAIDTAIQCIIKALQNHLEDSSLLEMACGALLGLIFNSESRKLQVGKEGIEAIIICGLVMHQHDLSILEKACELLASLSVVASLVPFIVEAQGVVNMVEAMRNHASSINLLRSGALCLKNIIIAQPDISDEAGEAVSATINAITTHIEDAAFQREACNFLWAVSVQSEDAKSKILALDGLAVLMDITLEQHADDPDVQKAALGAVNELMVINTTTTTTMPNINEGNHHEELQV